MIDSMERTVPLGKDDLTRIMSDDEAVTFEFDHAASVTLIAEKNRRKWEEHDRPEDAGDVFFLSREDAERVQHSKTGFIPDSNVRIIREASADTEQSHEANRDAVPENSKGRMPDEMYEATFDPMFDVADRWGIPMEDAEAFLESVGYFEHAATYNPEDEEHNA
jgi:hypothetical protein